MANQVVLLKDGSNNLYPEATLSGFNVGNIIASAGRGSAASYKATQDCFVDYLTYNNNGMPMVFYVDNVEIGQAAPGYDGFRAICDFLYPLKKGQTLTCKANGTSVNIGYKVFGIKYS